jgi:hypothetical protein
MLPWASAFAYVNLLRLAMPNVFMMHGQNFSNYFPDLFYQYRLYHDFFDVIHHEPQQMLSNGP